MNKVGVWRGVSVVLSLLFFLATGFAIIQYQTALKVQAKLDCALNWVEKAAKLHELHLKDSRTTTQSSQKELMDHIYKAYECLTGKEYVSENGHSHSH